MIRRRSSEDTERSSRRAAARRFARTSAGRRVAATLTFSSAMGHLKLFEVCCSCWFDSECLTVGSSWCYRVPSAPLPCGPLWNFSAKRFQKLISLVVEDFDSDAVVARTVAIRPFDVKCAHGLRRHLRGNSISFHGDWPSGFVTPALYHIYLLCQQLFGTFDDFSTVYTRPVSGVAGVLPGSDKYKPICQSDLAGLARVSVV